MNCPPHSATFPPALGSILFRYLTVAARNQTPFTEVLSTLGNDRRIFGRYAKKLKQLGNHPNPHIPLADLLTTQPPLFAATTIALIAEAEASQQLVLVLDALAGDCQRRQSIKKTPSLQPLILLVVLAMVIWIASVFVIPSFQRVFESLGGELPLPTQIVFVISDAIISLGWGIVPLVAAVVIIVRCNLLPAVLVRTFWQSYSHLPGIGTYFSCQLDTRLALWIASLGHIPPLLIAALRHIQDTSAVPRIHSIVAGLVTRLQAGENLVAACAPIPELPPSLTYAIRIAATTGNRSKDAMTLCQELTQEQFTQITVQMEHRLFFAFYLLIGSWVAFFVIAMYLPIFVLGVIV